MISYIIWILLLRNNCLVNNWANLSPSIHRTHQSSTFLVWSIIFTSMCIIYITTNKFRFVFFLANDNLWSLSYAHSMSPKKFIKIYSTLTAYPLIHFSYSPRLIDVTYKLSPSFGGDRGRCIHSGEHHHVEENHQEKPSNKINPTVS